jgi:chemotaxis-related protein WspB
MLFLTFQLDRDRYALDARQILEILPLATLKQVPHAAPWLAGVLDYRGAPIPVIDASALMLGRPSARHFGTRLVIVAYPGDGGDVHTLGLIAERATEMIRRDPGDFVPCGVEVPDAGYLGPVARDERGLIQRVDVRELLPLDVRDTLFRPSA